MALVPRLVLVHRTTELRELIHRHGTRGQAAFFQRTRGGTLDAYDAAQRHQDAALQTASAATPRGWRTATVERGDLDRFLFEPEDVVVVVGRDGLVANTAKYLDGQPVIGVDPQPGTGLGVLARHAADRLPALLQAVADGRAALERRTMAAAHLDDGQELHALNEIYLGHPTHQSARYTVVLPDGRHERHSSSGLIAATGTGATGWALSLARGRADAPAAPGVEETALTWFVREAWPSPTTGADLTTGRLAETEELTVRIESESLTVFGDGIESDHLTAASGQRVGLCAARRRLSLVVGVGGRG